ncbi:DUF3622 domain-containing protein [Ferrimonas lipolytica]|uniref:DUF3622 domain-containing protein n=1 Tax=Ferrimonas lipolytica TaxID=2724191 RepID=A0A6H1UBG4_9GAMM|nr:DUF3622 domain-containing protein [Ferrimonas lipolytica]QIZ76178.1 DUF3622 domain-containing protein [Ferrimonas lipolytica]
MAQSKKFSLSVEQTEDKWTAKIIRKVSNRKTMVSKKKGRFATEAEAQAWGEEMLQEFQKNQAERNDRHAKTRIEREAVAARQAEKAEQKAAEKRALRAEALGDEFDADDVAEDEEFDFSDFDSEE